VKLTTHLHLVPRSKNAWSYTSTPQYAFIAWCLVKKSPGTTLPFTFTCNSVTCSKFHVLISVLYILLVNILINLSFLCDMCKNLAFPFLIACCVYAQNIIRMIRFWRHPQSCFKRSRIMGSLNASETNIEVIQLLSGGWMVSRRIQDIHR
jgi:hypothetical protein